MRLAADAHARPANGIGGLYPALKALLEETVQRSGRRATLREVSGCRLRPGTDDEVVLVGDDGELFRAVLGDDETVTPTRHVPLARGGGLD